MSAQTQRDLETVKRYEERVVKRSANIAALRTPMPWDEGDVREIIAVSGRLAAIVEQMESEAA